MVVVWGLYSGIAAAAARGKAVMRLGVGVGKVGGRGRILAFLYGVCMAAGLPPVIVLLSSVKALLSW